MAKISLLKCDDYNRVNSAVKESVHLLGGISSFIKPGEKILIKPNLLAPKEPSKAVTTHPEAVKAVIQLVKSAGATPIVGDSPGGAVRDIKNLWKVTGMEDICTREKVELVNFEAAGSKAFDIGDNNVKRVNFSNAVLNCDGIINVPKLKTHSLMAFTAGIKNLYGCVPGLMKVEYHKLASKNKDFAHLLANIYLFLKNKIRFTIIDGVLAMEGNGPSSGEIRRLNVIAASADTALLDAVMLTSLRRDISKSEIFKKLMISKKDTDGAEIIGNARQDFNFENFKFPSLRKLDLMPKPLIKILGKFLWVHPEINEDVCVKCMMCKKSCPANAIYKIESGYPRVEDKKCISCFCCHEMCPYKAVDFAKSFLAKIFIKED
ncbi:DUF362 domain-containing protein [Endomicrobium proavitum]|uniref:4Fe-4S ferredoxin-type domain-containing protein n=1 Tax=Endomicrobium proavitum TaxID=1408281 RepID=A0A0G3WJM0_9BACT|nr:DUF362 domain-containing protein [Endomicrobium proavitum]AKL97694.1 hypothetical protein Epro_0315 [Endomicrobium proavitum]